MKITELFIEQLERERGGTRRALEQVPLDRADWKPHPKSMPLGYLATLVAIMPGWISSIVERDFLDLAQGSAPKTPASGAELVKLFEQGIGAARGALEKTSEEHLATKWQLRVGGKVVDQKERYAMIAETLTHFAHHRGQLTVYLRLNERSVPSIYGPTADERWA